MKTMAMTASDSLKPSGGNATKGVTAEWPFFEAFYGITGTRLPELEVLQPEKFAQDFTRALESALVNPFEAAKASNSYDLMKLSQKTFQTWLGIRQGTASYQAVLAAALLRAGIVYFQSLASNAVSGSAPQSPMEAFRAWTKTVDQVLMKTLHEKNYVQAQNGMIRAEMEYRQSQQDLVNKWFQLNGLPTMPDLDEAYRRIAELRRELRALKRSADREYGDQREEQAT
jgi:hypothetical protein